MNGTSRPEVNEERREPDQNSLVEADPSNRFPNEVHITKVSNGFIVHVGCQTFVGRDWEEVSGGLDLYWIHPEKAEQLYLKK